MKEERVLDPESQVEYVVPAYSTPDETLDRARRIAQGRLGLVYMASFSTRYLPPLEDEGGGAVPISDGLRERLNRWFDYGREQPDSFAEDPGYVIWEMLGDELYEKVVAELWSSAVVVRP
ncbi:hypothetical protein ACQUSY_07175 [Microbacterium sp. YY-03]|uniref:Uncharacterized protein n=1 Tax=Microbacterium mitrae TaxID=664640 RepID=A0A5C8HM09_9MICO|nr:hypothetical protein [Microbacterium mitrae]TXK04528.1 hypothetical protein FVP60_07515 [Microbacterium mitrae]